MSLIHLDTVSTSDRGSYKYDSQALLICPRCDRLATGRVVRAHEWGTERVSPGRLFAARAVYGGNMLLPLPYHKGGLYASEVVNGVL